MSDDDNLFSRWSNRKRAVAEEKATLDTTPDPKDEAAVSPVEGAEHDGTEETAETEEEILARFGLPNPESLGPGDDYTGFMQSGVPEFLRRRALRRLWRSNPVLANVDGLNDYDEDFTSPEETMKVLKTAYKVGRGFLRDPEDEVVSEEEVGPEALADADTDTRESVEPETLVAEENGIAPSRDPADALDTENSSSAQGQTVATGSTDVDETTQRRPRRMRFQT